MRRIAALVLALSACGDHDGGSPGVPAAELCPAMVQAVCDRETACGTYTDSAACVVDMRASELYDGCLLDVDAVTRWEVSYNGGEAADFVDAIRAGDCGSALPDFVTQFEVFTPKLEEGAVCHSYVSCKAGLTCADLTPEDPLGICRVI